MVTKLNSVEIENIWNSIVKCDDFDSNWRNSHWGIREYFDYDDIEANKPNGWNKLRKIISDIETRCVVYYYCEDFIKSGKYLYFVIFGENAIDEVLKISTQLAKMTGYVDATIDSERERMKHDNGTDKIEDTIEAHCPLF